MANEKRLIDANALIKEANAEGAYGYVDAKQIADAPTVDAVEVVRCRDCKHKGWVQEPCHGRSLDYCKLWECVLDNLDTTFCSYGERKDGDGNAQK